MRTDLVFQVSRHTLGFRNLSISSTCHLAILNLSNHSSDHLLNKSRCDCMDWLSYCALIVFKILVSFAYNLTLQLTEAGMSFTYSRNKSCWCLQNMTMFTTFQINWNLFSDIVAASKAPPNPLQLDVINLLSLGWHIFWKTNDYICRYLIWKDYSMTVALRTTAWLWH